MKIAVAKEIDASEPRVAVTPDTIKKFKALGAEVTMLMRFSESPDPPPPGMVPPGSENKIMHAAFRIGDSLVMASDGGCAGTAKFSGVSLSISVRRPIPAPARYCRAGEPISRTTSCAWSWRLRK